MGGFVFLSAVLAVSSELFFGVMLGVKAWSHLVYVVISFALLGHGAGALLFHLLQRRLARADATRAAAVCLSATALACWAASRVLPPMDWHLRDSLLAPEVLASLAATQLTVALPFVGAGFLLALALARGPGAGHTLYFLDLAGAATGALAFVPLLSLAGPQPAVAALSAGAVVAAALARRSRLLLALSAVMGASVLMPESTFLPLSSLSWESVPHRFAKEQFQTLSSAWHPMGRTELYRLIEPASRRRLYAENLGTFEINLDPPPDFAIFANNYRSATPVFETSPAGLERAGSRLRRFSQTMEAPYLLVKQPRVVIIGTGGGRDIFMARAHGAASVTGAEVNPATFAAMSRGGVAFAFSGGLYEAPGVNVVNADGRHLVKTLAPGSSDLVILNGADTFAAIAGGAYTFAESYLYTREAFVDDLRLLGEDGILNVNRWLEPERPREGLRLVVCLFDALRSLGVPRPWEHVLVGREYPVWGITLVRKRPFTQGEEERLRAHFEAHGASLVLGPHRPGEAGDAIGAYVAACRAGRGEQFIAAYDADVSPVTDDRPYFYKHHRFVPGRWSIREIWHPAGGGQALVVLLILAVQTALFVGALILGPLCLLGRPYDRELPRAEWPAFFGYFGGIGAGFMLIELALMQKLVLPLGSPLYSVPVTLGCLILSAGAGSRVSEGARRAAGGARPLLTGLSVLVVLAVGAWVGPLDAVIEWLLARSFPVRILGCCALVAPLGIGLGMWMPVGLALVARRYPALVPWAVGVNSGFTVAGGVLSLLIAQGAGFRATLVVAALLYLTAGRSYRQLEAGA